MFFSDDSSNRKHEDLGGRSTKERDEYCTNVMNSGIRALAVAWLLSVPGAASTDLETVVPYSQISMIQLLGKIPDKFCTQHTVEEMALLAYNHALKLSSPGGRFGL